ncbi:YIEGIA family protein [Caldalkalibacillus salinus]|uniref:YIEGIA family protein n=1 Tax=Caldalkalibacillus salinus TaxID=2803787 RepID=UPI00192125AD|nr:YIEGIA family protein [Caldalkalibacillus salinus]
MEDYALATTLGVALGFLGRVVMLKTDYRQYPTYPHGSIIHLALGFIAAALGSIAVPALYEKEFTAITFLSLAAQQFREVRNMERNTLSELDSMEMVSRGTAYIEGIAMAFEGRNYLVILTAFLTSLSVMLINWWVGIVVGLLSIILAYIYHQGSSLKKIADIHLGQVRFEGPNLFVDDIHIMNVGVKESQKLILERGLGFVINPKSMDSIVTLSNLGQRQAILHDLSVGLGVYRDAGNPSLTPLTRRDINDGRVAVFFLPQIKSEAQAKNVISKVPILENAVRIPSESDALHEERKG